MRASVSAPISEIMLGNLIRIHDWPLDTIFKLLLMTEKC